VNVVIFGASGKSGLLVTKSLLEKGHHVTAYLRNPGKLGIRNDKLAIAEGALNDNAQIAAVIQGKDAVISLLGPSGSGNCDELITGVQFIVAAMQQHQVKRFIAISTASAVDPLDQFALSFWLAIHAIKLLQPHAWKYFVQTAELIRNSGLEWTLVRLGMLSDKENYNPPALGYVGAKQIKLFSLSRNVLADFLVAQLNDTTWIGKAPAISNQV
jgi:putative NADH-flavin reductase